MENNSLQYPIGKFKLPESITEEALQEAITVLQLFPEQLKLVTYQLPDKILDTPYRPGGWTIRQLIHHIADSHHHAYNRLRWALTEDTPTIKAYDQDAFAKMQDYQHAPIAWSLSHIEVLHQKMVYILKGLKENEWSREFTHPETKKNMSVKELVLLYAWHSMHHFSHIRNALK